MDSARQPPETVGGVVDVAHELAPADHLAHESFDTLHWQIALTRLFDDGVDKLSGRDQPEVHDRAQCAVIDGIRTHRYRVFVRSELCQPLVDKTLEPF